MFSSQPPTEEIPLQSISDDLWEYSEDDDSHSPSKPIVEKPSALNGVSQTVEIAELSSSSLNKLLHDQIQEQDKSSLVGTGTLRFNKNNRGYARPLKYFIIEKNYPCDESDEKTEKKAIKKRIVFFEVTKDAETEENQPHLYNICNLLQARDKIIPTESTVVTTPPENPVELKETLSFLAREKSKDSIFVMPLHQCRGLFSLPAEYVSKAHVVLAIYDNKSNQLSVYDSQGGLTIPILEYNLNISLPNFVYPDKFKEKNGYDYKGTVPLRIQKFPHLCGYFVNTLRGAFLQDGNISRFGKIDLNPSLIKFKENYLDKHLSITQAILEGTANEIEADWVCLDVEGQPKISVDKKLERMSIKKDAEVYDTVSLSVPGTLFSSREIKVEGNKEKNIPVKLTP